MIEFGPVSGICQKKKIIDFKDKEKARVIGITRAYAEEMSNYLAVSNSEVSNT